MKIINIVLLAFLMIGVAAFGQKPATFSIKGKITGLDDSTKLNVVLGATHKDEKPLAESIIKGGEFQVTLNADEPRLLFINVANTYSFIDVMVENTDVTITAEALTSKNGDGKLMVEFKSVEISGATLHPLYKQKMAFREGLNAIYEANNKKHEAIGRAYNNAMKSKDQVRIDSVKNSDAWKSSGEDSRLFFVEVEAKISHAILTDKDSWWGPLLMMNNMNYLQPKDSTYYNQFSPAAKNSFYGKLAYDEIHPKRLVKLAAPGFKLNDREEKAFSSADLMKGKKYVLVDFWASWCNPCRKEIPNLKNLYSLYASKGLQIISVSIDKDKAAWMKALDAEKMPWPNLFNDDTTANSYMVKTIPALFLVNERGIVVADDLRGETLDAKLKEIFQ